MIVLCAGRETWIEYRPLNVIVWVRVDAVSGFGRRINLKIPGTPAFYKILRHGGIERYWERTVRAREGVGGGTGTLKERRRANADRIHQVGGDLREGRVAGLRIEGDDGNRDVVAINERKIVEGLAAGGGERELRQGDRRIALVVLSVLWYT